MRLPAVAVGTLALALAACSPAPDPAPKSPAAGAASSGAGASRAPAARLASVEEVPSDKGKQTSEDAALTEKVRSAIAGDAAVRGLSLEIDSNAGVVRLRGMVPNDEAKQRAQELAQKVPGVKWVQNQVSVAPRSG